ncbi:MAG: copper homeostasis protein CutC [Bacteroidota bacterium]
MPVKLEVCIDSVASALAAEKAGAHRLELCGNLAEGGTTPSSGMVQTIQAVCSLPIMMMIRPRGGDFLYSRMEFAVMERDIEEAKRLKVAGVVLGLLSKDGNIDKSKTARLIERARPLPVTFHRAFDMTRNSKDALKALRDLGVDRLLTSGREATAPEGSKLIAQLVKNAGRKLKIMPGGGLNAENVAQLVAETGVAEVHATGSHILPSEMEYRNEKIFMGVPGMPEYSLKQSSPENIKAILAALNG